MIKNLLKRPENGYQAVCAFVSSDVGEETVRALQKAGVRLILMRCAGFNNVDLKTAKACGITVMRVPGYSPEAVAEHAMALALAVNRRLHKAYVKVRGRTPHRALISTARPPVLWEPARSELPWRGSAGGSA